MDLFIGALLVVCGYLLCFFTNKPPKIVSNERKKVVSVKTLPDFKNPLQPYKKYTNKDDLYVPQKPKKKGVKDDA